MLNFKQYLLKENNSQYHATNVKFVVDLSFAKKLIKHDQTLIRIEIKERFPHAKVEFSEYDATVTFENIQQSNLLSLDDIVDTLNGVCNVALGYDPDDDELVDRYTGALVFNGIPPYVVNHEQIVINCDEHVTGLSGLDKVIGPDVYELTINELQNVKGNILSLCKLNCNFVYLEWKRGIVDAEKYQTIENLLEKYRPTHDIISFQEDLLDNQLGEYAKS